MQLFIRANAFRAFGVKRNRGDKVKSLLTEANED
jgi:hypothetical protein